MTPVAKTRGALARQLTGGLTAVMFGIGLLMLPLLWQVQREQSERLLAEWHEVMAREIMGKYQQQVEREGRLEQFERDLAELVNVWPQVDRVVLAVDGQIRAQAAHRGMLTVGPAVLEPVSEPGPPRVFSFGLDETLDQYVSTLRFQTLSSRRPAYVAVSVSGERVWQRMQGTLWRLGQVALISASVLVLGLYLMLRQMVTRPLRQLALAADRVATGDLTARVAPWSDNEIGAAGTAVNAMADTLIAQAETVRASEERMRVLLQSASDAWFLVNEATHVIVDVNDEAARLVARPRRSLIGVPFKDIVPPESHGAVDALCERLRADELIRNAEELRVLRDGGPPIPVSVNARSIPVDGERIVFASLRDISEQRRAQETIARQLRHLTALNATSRACSTSLDPEQICRAVHQEVCAAMPCDAFVIELWEERPRRMVPVFLVDSVDGARREIAGRASHPLAEGSPYAEVIQTQRPLRIHRGAGEAPAAGLQAFGELGRPSRSLLFAPMVSGQRVVGVISAQSYAPEAYSEEDLDLLTAMARQAGLALANARLHQATQRSLVLREALNHIAKAIGATFDLQGIARIVYEDICRLLPVDSFFLSVIEPDASRDHTLLMVDTIDGERCEIDGNRESVPLAAKHTGHIVRTRQPHLELREPDAIPNSPFHPYGDRTRRSASLMFVPMIARDRVVGVLSVQSYTPRAYTQEDLDLLQGIGDLTALALEGARLYHQVATSEARYRALVENADVSIILTDLDGRINMWNRGAERIFGHRPEDVLGLSLSELFLDEAHNAERIQEALAEGRTWTSEGHARHRRGHALELVYSVAQVTDANGRVVGRVVIASDLTEKKTLERALLQAQKMESIGTLAGGIAHDFNNLLTGIMGYASYLQTQAEPGTRLSRDLDQIERAAKRASELTAQLLAFSRKQLMRRQSINLNQVVDETVRLMERTLGKHITIEVVKDPNLHVVEADPTQMQQVLMNLAINARDAMPGGGLLRLTTRNFLADEAQCLHRPELTPGPNVQVAVLDTGKGMDEDTIERIFDPFFTTKPVGEGTGLGLAMVYGIVRSHGGLIDVQSRPGQGTEFIITLPVVTEPTEGVAPSQDESELRGGSETVLLVDDEPVILRLGASILERYGYTVLTAPSGKAALNLYQQQRGRIDLVVLDMVMPEMNGAELARHLREIASDCKILLSSGYAIDQGAEEIFKTGGLVGFLPKPYRMSQLVHHVRRALDTPVAKA